MNIHILKSPAAAFPFVTCDNVRAFTIEITVYFLLYFKITVQSGIRNSFSCNLWRENKEEEKTFHHELSSFLKIETESMLEFPEG